MIKRKRPGYPLPPTRMFLSVLSWVLHKEVEYQSLFFGGRITYMYGRKIGASWDHNHGRKRLRIHQTNGRPLPGWVR